jgi:hypothetical protein
MLIILFAILILQAFIRITIGKPIGQLFLFLFIFKHILMSFVFFKVQEFVNIYLMIITI